MRTANGLNRVMTLDQQSPSRFSSQLIDAAHRRFRYQTLAATLYGFFAAFRPSTLDRSAGVNIIALVPVSNE